MIKKVKIGDRIKYMSAAGIIYGEILSMSLARNGKNELIPWMVIEHYVGNNKRCVEIPATESYLTMMKFEVLFRDAA